MELSTRQREEVKNLMGAAGFSAVWLMTNDPDDATEIGFIIPEREFDLLDTSLNIEIRTRLAEIIPHIKVWLGPWKVGVEPIVAQLY